MEDEIYILWHSDNFITAEKLVFKYAINCLLQGWFKKVTVIIWGASSKMAEQDERIQHLIKKGMEQGVKFTACKACADELDTSDVLESLGVEVIYWGQPLSDLLKQGKKVLSI